MRVLSSFVERESSSGRYEPGFSETRRKNKSPNTVVIEDAFHLVLVGALGIVNQKYAQQGMDLFFFLSLFLNGYDREMDLSLP